MRTFATMARCLGGLALLGTAASAWAQLALSEAERLARDLNPILAVSKADVEAAEAAASGLMAPYRPMLGLMLYGGRRQGMAMDQGFGLEMLDGVGSGGSAMFSWKVYSGGQDRTARELGANAVAMAKSRGGMAWQMLLVEVRLEFAEASKLQDEVEAAAQMVEAAKELERVTVERFEAGKLPEAFVFGARADRLRAEGELAKRKAALDGALARITACCGIEITGGRVGAWDVPSDVPDTLEAAIEKAYAGSPEVAMRVQQAGEWLWMERKAAQSGVPDLRVVAGADRAFAGAGMEDRGTQAGLVLSWPIGDGGMRKAEAAEARKRRTEAESAVAVAKNAIRAEVTAAWAEWVTAPHLLEAARGMVAAADEGYRVAKLRYEEGKAIRAEVSQALADQFEARTLLAEAERYRRAAWSKVVRFWE